MPRFLMPDIRHRSTANAPARLVFEYVDDYRTVPDWMFGISQFEPVGDQDRGVGAVFDGAIMLGPTTLRSTVKCIEWEQDTFVAVTSIRGFVNSSAWTFTPLGDDRTQLSVDFHYELPGGLAGKALGRVIEPFISIAIRHSETALRAKVEQLYAEQA